MTAAGSADHGHDKGIQIVINGRKHTVEAKELSFKEIVDLAYDNNPPLGGSVSRYHSQTVSIVDPADAGALVAPELRDDIRVRLRPHPEEPWATVRLVEEAGS